ncbi:hypothetical protein ACIP4U_39365 [Streptomyces caelestis]|uniref:hypothetical protein n=1 Tax=Streptomyces caelestis TaxID=36816 RepID=UPI003803DDDE
MVRTLTSTAIVRVTPARRKSWTVRLADFLDTLHTLMTTSMRISNAKAGRELGWAPTVPTYREGIPLVTKAGR